MFLLDIDEREAFLPMNKMQFGINVNDTMCVDFESSTFEGLGHILCLGGNWDM